MILDKDHARKLKRALRSLKGAELNSDPLAACIAEALNDLAGAGKGDFLALVKLRYVDDLPVPQVCDRLHVARSTFYAWQQELLTYIGAKAQERGLLAE